MKRILFIADDCFRSSLANGFCINNVIKELSKDSYVDVVTFDQCEGEEIINENLKVYYICNLLPILGNSNRRIIQRVIKKLIFELICPDLNILYIKRMQKKICELLEINKYDIVVASTGGYVSQIAAFRVKKKYQFDIVSYFLDPPAMYNCTFNQHRPYILYYRWFDKYIYKNAKAILADESIYNAIIRENVNNNFYKVGIPLLIKRNIVKSEKRSGKKIAYFGTLYPSIRKPDYAIELLSMIPGTSVDFYGGPTTEIVISSYCGDRVHYRGLVSHDDMTKVIRQYDYLLNISNDNTTQIPSKIIDYISYLKPIINISKKYDDTCALIDQYGNGVSLIEGDDNNYAKLIRFINKEHSSSSFDTLIEKFEIYLPQYTAEIIRAIVEQ